MDARIREALDRCTGPTLVYDLRTLDANLRALADAARAAQITPLFAMKSFPHPRVRELAARHLGGFDAASSEEVSAAVRARGDGVLSLFDPGGQATPPAGDGRRVIVSCETVEQVQRAPAHVDVAIRVSASITGRDPAIGAIADGSGHRVSRFGLMGGVEELVKVAGRRRVGIHLHHGPVTATNAERFIASARAALDVFPGDPAFVNLGGAWHGIVDLATAFQEVRRALGEIELLVEPGRAIARDVGFAVGRVLLRRELADRSVRVSELSRVCHLRWSQPELVVPPPRAEERRKVVVLGPTCYEEDVIGEWTVDIRDVDDRIVLRNVTGYALAWNTAFAGVPPASVVMLD